MYLQSNTTTPQFQVLPWTNQEVTIPDPIEAVDLFNVPSNATFFPLVSNFGSEDSTPNENDANLMVRNIPLPEIRSLKSVTEGALTTVIQIWEGVVLSVDHNNGTMTAKLTDRTGMVMEHSAEIDLQWVVEQDRDLLTQGAVFYWTLYKETKRGSIKNSQEIKFRRLPNWSKSNIKSIYKEAESLITKFTKATRFAE